MEHFNTTLIAEITKKMPDKKRPVNYLTELLSLGKESAYRRIKNQIPFTVEEVAIIAKDLNLSIDQLHGFRSNNLISFATEFTFDQELLDINIRRFEYDNEMMEKFLASSNLKISAAVNRVPMRFFPFETLFKLEYCHYLYSIGQIPLMTRFSDIIVPQQVIDLQKKSAEYFSQLQNVTCILDNMVYAKILNEIKYYYQLKFLSIDDIHIMQKELFELLDMYESILRKGKNNAGGDCVYYYSLLNLDSNICFFEFDDNFLLQLWIYPESPLMINNSTLMRDVHKRWFDSLVRNSMLISRTNDTLIIETFRKIFNQISDLAKKEEIDPF